MLESEVERAQEANTIISLNKKLRNKKEKLRLAFEADPEKRKVYSKAINNLNLLVKILSKGERSFTRGDFISDVNEKYEAIKRGKAEPMPFKMPEVEEEFTDESRKHYEYGLQDVLDEKDGEKGVAFSKRSYSTKEIVIEQLAWRAVVTSKTEEIFAWYDRWEDDIKNQRKLIDSYHTLSPAKQRESNSVCTEIFKDFHASLNNFGVLRGRVKVEFETSEDTITAITEMISEMAKSSGIRLIGGGGAEKQEEMAGEFHDALVDFIDLKVWNSSIESEMKKVRGVDKRPIYNYQFAYMTLQKDRSVLERAVKVGGPIADLLKEGIKQFDSEKQGGGKDKSDFSAQDANLSWIFAPVYTVLVSVLSDKSVSIADKQTVFQKRFIRLCHMLQGKDFGFINAKDITPYFARNGDPWMKAINFDKLGAGGEFHKYQHMLLVSPKIFVNGMCAFTHIGCLGMLVNYMSFDGFDVILHLIDSSEKIISEMDASVCGMKQDEKMIYFRTRVSFWLVHTYLKGTINAGTYTGHVKGNALKAQLRVSPGRNAWDIFSNMGLLYAKPIEEWAQLVGYKSASSFKVPDSIFYRPSSSKTRGSTTGM